MTQAFADELAHFAENAGCPQVKPIIARLRRPVRVAVLGRDGVGRGTVAAALAGHGVALVANDAGEVRVVVIAEAVKPEDRQLLTSSRLPTVLVLTKADLGGAGPGSPMTAARRRAASIGVTSGTPTVPVIGLLSALGADALDQSHVAALRAFVAEPADLSSVDAFLDGPHPVGRAVRTRLLERLDRFGIAHAVLALAGGCDPGELATQLRHLGNLDEVLAALEVAAAPVRYLRIRAATSELRSLAHRLDDDRVAALAAADDTVLALMTAAVDVVTAAGLTVDRGDTRAAHVNRAVHWHRYGSGPVNALHRRCSDDIVRGSLRLLAGRST